MLSEVRVAVFDVIRKFGNNWIKSMEEEGGCALTTGWKHWEVGSRGGGVGGDWELPWDAGQGEGGYRGGREEWN